MVGSGTDVVRLRKTTLPIRASAGRCKLPERAIVHPASFRSFGDARSIASRTALAVFALLAAFALIFPIYTTAAAEDQNPSGEAFSEQRVKAAFLFNFLKFISLPQPEGAPPRSSVSICLYGRSDLAIYRKELEGKSVGGVAIQAVERQPGQSIDGCSVIYFRDPEPKPPEFLQRIRSRGILTVGETPDFFSHGGIIRFVIKENKVRFEINNRRAEEEAIRISADLLKLALSVEQ